MKSSIDINIGKKGIGGGMLGGILGGGGTASKLLNAVGKISVIAVSIGIIAKGISILTRYTGIITGTLSMMVNTILRPIAIFMNTLLRPYMMKALAATRTGALALRDKTPEGNNLAVQSFALAAGFMLEPLAQAIAPSTERLEDMDRYLGILMGSTSNLDSVTKDQAKSLTDLAIKLVDTGIASSTLTDGFWVASSGARNLGKALNGLADRLNGTGTTTGMGPLANTTYSPGGRSNKTDVDNETIKTFSGDVFDLRIAGIVGL